MTQCSYMTYWIHYIDLVLNSIVCNRHQFRYVQFKYILDLGWVDKCIDFTKIYIFYVPMTDRQNASIFGTFERSKWKI